LIPPLINLSKLTAQHCQIRNLKYIDSKFPNLNIGNFKNNSIGLYEEIESIKGIDYLAEFDIRNNPLAFRPAVQEMIVADVPDLEVYNEIELLEPGFKYKVENEELKRRLAETNKEEEELLEKILDKVFDEQGEPQEKRMTQKAIQEKFEEVENNCHKNEVELVKAQLSISANLVPLTRDKNKISEVEEFTGEQLIKESVDFKKRVKSDYETIRKDFRKVVNQLRFDELEFSQKMNSSKPDVDLYIEMLNEIKKFDQQSKINRAKFGFMTSRSDEKDSDDELEKAVPLYKENASSIIYDSTMHDEFEQIENKKKRNNSLIRKSNNKSKPLPFRSSAGFNKANKQDLTGQKIQKKTVRAGSARKKLPPTPGNKEKLNELKELKMTQEKDRIMGEFNKLVSKTTTSFKEPKFPRSTRKNVLEPIRPPSNSASLGGDADFGLNVIKNISKFSKPNMLAAQNEAIREMLRTKTNEN
jgi:hypothetical protein